MGFFDDLKVLGSDLLAKSSVVAKEAAQKASDAADMAKIKVDIAAREREIKDDSKTKSVQFSCSVVSDSL